MERKDIIKIDEWIDKFNDPNSTGYDLADDISFASLCEDLGFILDDGRELNQKYGINSYEEVLNILDKVEDYKILGNALFSYWRYFNHWAYSISDILNHRDWFIKVLNKLKNL